MGIREKLIYLEQNIMRLKELVLLNKINLSIYTLQDLEEGIDEIDEIITYWHNDIKKEIKSEQLNVPS